MTQLLDPSGEYACIWDEGLQCPVEPLLTVSEEEKLAFAFGKYQPECDLSCPTPVPLPGGVWLLLAALAVLAGLGRLAKARAG